MCRPCPVTRTRSTPGTAGLFSGRWTHRTARPSGSSTRCRRTLWSRAHKNINSSSGLSNAPTFDSRGQPLYRRGKRQRVRRISNFPWGSSRPGPDLYTDLDRQAQRRRGRAHLALPLTPHDVYDYDLEDSPILATANGSGVSDRRWQGRHHRGGRCTEREARLEALGRRPQRPRGQDDLPRRKARLLKAAHSRDGRAG